MNFGPSFKNFQIFKKSDYPTKFLQDSDEMLLIRELNFCVFDLNFSRFEESLIFTNFSKFLLHGNFDKSQKILKTLKLWIWKLFFHGISYDRIFVGLR